jgi:hypothetical protein
MRKMPCERRQAVSDETTTSPRWKAALAGWFWRAAASGLARAAWFERNLPDPSSRAAATGPLDIEIVSHCWRYAHFLMYQLSSLVNFPPQKPGSVTMTVYYDPSDTNTVRVLDFFSNESVPRVRWNWQPLPKEILFRRAIGRNRSALATTADWIWFTDCDVMFREQCLDQLVEAVQGRRDALVFPRSEHCTPLLPPDSAVLNVNPAEPRVIDVDPAQFTRRDRSRATGPLQIVHGDVARACGYCNAISFYQQPAETWRKAYEDRALRWLLRTQGTPLDVRGVYRIRHAEKGRYKGGTMSAGIRGSVRRVESWMKERRLADRDR